MNQRPASVGCPRRWGAGAAFAALVAAAAAAWYPILGPPVGQVAPLAAVAVLVAAGLLPRRVAVGTLVACPPAALLLAGAPAAQLMPGAWRSSAALLEEGARQLAAPGSAHVAHDAWPLAAGLLLAGAIWMAAAALAAPASPSGRRRSAAFVIAALPWIAAVAREPADAPVWQGAVVVLAGLLWCLSLRMAARAAVTLSVVVALAAAATAQTVGPEQRWFRLPGAGAGPPSFRTLTIEPTFGPLPDRRVGHSMLEIHAAEPALWRMQTLELFDWFGWDVAKEPSPELPQPAARPLWADVRVRALRNDLVVAPGRITQVAGTGEHKRVAGDAWRLTPPPGDGTHYRVVSEVVLPGVDELRRAPAPSDPRLRRYTRLGRPPYFAVDMPLFGMPPEPATTRELALTPYRSIAGLAGRLAAGAATEWDVVARVQHYLRDSGRFRYTTDVPSAGLLPLVDFLLRDHAGYCQHFAGAAALLLRLAGVPARVVAGFATGSPKRGGGFDVRDIDAHDWVEVYFQGYGWVPFNPTPPAASAHVPSRLDLLAPPSTRADGGWRRRRMAGALLAALTLALRWAARRRRRRAQAHPGEQLARLARRAGARVEESSTLGELRAELALRLGPNTSALAAAAERARYAPGVAEPGPPLRAGVVRAVVSDLGPARAALLLVLPVGRNLSRRRG